MNQKELFQSVRANYPVDLSAVAGQVKERHMVEFQPILRTAENAVAGKFAFQLRWDMEQTRTPVEFPGEIDWLFQPGDDPEFIFAFNRMKFWVCMGQAYQITGNEKYAQAYARQLCHWVDNVKRSNPACEKAWRTIEAGIRMEVWSKAIGYFEGSPALNENLIDHYISSMTDHAELYYVRVELLQPHE